MEDAVEEAQIVHLVAPGPTPLEISNHMASTAGQMLHPSRDFEVRAAIMIILTDEAPLVAHIGMRGGNRGFDDYCETSAVLTDVHLRYIRSDDEEQTLNEYLAQRWRNRQENRRRNDEAAKKKLAETPWSCEFCRHRYKTERGCVKHEQQFCQSNPKSAFFSSGDYVPLNVKNGKANGYSMTDQGRRKHDEEMRRRGYRVV